MDILWIIIAFACGMAVKILGQPPLVGFLAAGFLLNALGVARNETLDALAATGITLMLFTIGLKLDVRSLLKREVWAGTLAHAGVWCLVVAALILGVGALGLPFLTGIDLATAALLSFALSFSSTVCIIKVLEESGELKSRHGKLAVGVLVLQDIVAVVFLVLATGELPSIWSFGLLGLYFLRPLLGFLMTRAGHGEMLPLLGFLLALGGYQLFSALGVKGDLGALVVGTLLNAHPKSGELSRSLGSFKDLFLVGFFLTIGLTALPDLGMVLAALGLCLALPLKSLLFFFLLVKLRLRARTSFLAALALGNYSEFGLIVAFLSVESGWLSHDWLVVLALSASLSFVVTSLIYNRAHSFYARWKPRLRPYESPDRLPQDQVFRPQTSEILVVGTGRVGLGAFQALHRMVGDRVWGMDSDRDLIASQRAEGMHVFAGDAENADVWEAMDISSIKLVLLTVPSITDCKNITEQLRIAGYAGRIAAVARYKDEAEILRESGIDKVFNFFTEAGIGFAEDSLRLIEEPGLDGPGTAEI